MARDIDIDWNEKETQDFLDPRKKQLLIEHALKDILQHVQTMAKAKAPEWTGNLKRNIFVSHIEPTKTGKSSHIYTGNLHMGPTAPYAKWVESGTGIYGPFHTPIVPKTSSVLVWHDRFTGDLNVRRAVRGQPGQHFMRDAVIETRSVYIPLRLARLRREITAAT